MNRLRHDRWGRVPGRIPFERSRCYRFDGLDDYVDFGDVLDARLADVALECWVKTSNVATQGLMCKHDVGGSNKYLMYINAEGKLRFQFYSSAHLLTSTTVVANGDIHHCVSVADRSGNATVLVDGVSEGTLDISPLAAVDMNAVDEFMIGSLTGDPLYTLLGQLGNARQYDFGAGGLPSNFVDLFKWNTSHPYAIHPDLRPHCNLWAKCAEGQGAICLNSINSSVNGTIKNAVLADIHSRWDL